LAFFAQLCIILKLPAYIRVVTVLSFKLYSDLQGVIKLKFLILVFSMAIITGCAGKFTKPIEGEDNAKLRFLSVPSDNNLIHIPTSKRCITGDGEEQIAVLGSRANSVRKLSRNGIPLYDTSISDSHQNEVYVRAGREFSFQFNGYNFNYRDSNRVRHDVCKKIITFKPEKNKFYEARYDTSWDENRVKTCSAVLYEISKNSNGIYQRNEVSNYKIISNYCKYR
jgi:hypothetical protein